MFLFVESWESCVISQHALETTGKKLSQLAERWCKVVIRVKWSHQCVWSSCVWLDRPFWTNQSGLETSGLIAGASTISVLCVSSSFFLLLSLSSSFSLVLCFSVCIYHILSLLVLSDESGRFVLTVCLLTSPHLDFSTGEVSDRLSASFSLTVRRLTACDNVNEDETHYSVSSSFCQQTQPSEPQYSVGLCLITSTPIGSYYNRNIKYDLFKLLICIIMYIICVCCLRCDWWWEESRATRRRREKKRNRKCLPVQTAQDRLLLKVLLLKVDTQIQCEKVTEYIYLIVFYFCSTECQREMFYSSHLSLNFHFKIWCEVFEVN